ncbi:tyrosine-type recombinase/integrase [uncultured Amaricoccus sp.]|uniref:tyrosine-type recombinase/integrase n=1 Tax=uncultured Amaricoccus sp. TaxID=339341 RepID=UPI00262A87FF|nr:tyrosine-type recombinase/integrase [uncultured Amaricoccus sp.]HRO27397.1 tyrosine-type recombinase/integrase [Luteimonas sp.]
MTDAINLSGIHRVPKTLSGGRVRIYHYVYRGGPQFWNSDSDIEEGSDAYKEAFRAAKEGERVGRVPADRYSVPGVVARFRQSAHYLTKEPRTKGDYDEFLDSFEEEFREDSIKMFEEKQSVGEINAWKNGWARSKKRYDYATTVATLFLNWAKDTDCSIDHHYHVRTKRLYKAGRAEIIWLPGEIDALRAVATEREERVLIAASQGLTPQDIGILTQDHVQRTPEGRRLYFRRTKTSNPVSIPVTPEMGRLIDTTPANQKYLVVSLTGKKLTAERASGIIRKLKRRANAAAAADPMLFHVRDELRANDLRGTAATELLRAGCSLNEIAVTMGWGLRHAGNIIERYAALVPEVADEVMRKLAAARKRADEEKKEREEKEGKSA